MANRLLLALAAAGAAEGLRVCPGIAFPKPVGIAGRICGNPLRLGPQGTLRPSGVALRHETRLGRRQQHGVFGLRSQINPVDETGDDELEGAEAAEGAIQKYVLGGIAGIFGVGFLGYCASTGQAPWEVASALSQTDFKQSMTDLVEYIDGLGPIGLVYFASVYIVAEMLAIPAIPLTASAGYLFGVTKGTIVVLLSATIAAGGAFLVGRVLLRTYVEKIIAKSRKFQAIDEAISRKGFQLVLLLRLSPLLPFAISNYIYGTTKVNFGEYLAATLIGFAPGTLAFVITGQVGKELSGGVGAGQEGMPWYGYAAGAAGIFYLGSVVARIAGKAIEEVEAESEARLDLAALESKREPEGPKDELKIKAPH